MKSIITHLTSNLAHIESGEQNLYHKKCCRLVLTQMTHLEIGLVNDVIVIEHNHHGAHNLKIMAVGNLLQSAFMCLQARPVIICLAIFVHVHCMTCNLSADEFLFNSVLQQNY